MTIIIHPSSLAILRAKSPNQHRYPLNQQRYHPLFPELVKVKYTVPRIPTAPFSHEGDVFLVVLVTKEGLLATIAALGNVMGKTGCYYSCYSSHELRIAEQNVLSIKYTVPGIPRYYP
jgi:hypothetical protein